MIHLKLEIAAVNPPRLHEELHAALGDTFHGLSLADTMVTVHLSASATPQQQDSTRAIVAAHDPNQLTEAQSNRQTRLAHPFFTLDAESLAEQAATMDGPSFQQGMAHAFAQLRDIVGTAG